MDEYDYKMAKKLEEQHNQKMHNAKVIKQQLYEFKVNTIKQIKNERLEGEIIKR